MSIPPPRQPSFDAPPNPSPGESSRSGDSQFVQQLPSDTKTVVINLPPRRIWPLVLTLLGAVGLLGLTALCLGGFVVSAIGAATDELANATPDGISETSLEGSGDQKLAIIDMSGTIGPPYTDDWLAQIKKATEDDDVAGVLLHVDSPGGLVADSHQIYHRLTGLSAKKPVAVQFGRLAASGGYYVAMGCGPDGIIVAEPTTWTGSIGVIVPYYNVTDLAEKVGVDARPLKTGKFKDTLSPFKPLTEDEVAVWDEIIEDAFDRFKDVIESARTEMTRGQIDDAATGQIFTAEQAIERGLVDRIGYRDETLELLAEQAGVSDPHIIRYESPASPLSLLLGQATATEPDWAGALRTMQPEARYQYGWPATLVPR